jgi:hypothetical protein
VVMKKKKRAEKDAKGSRDSGCEQMTDDDAKAKGSRDDDDMGGVDGEERRRG